MQHLCVGAFSIACYLQWVNAWEWPIRCTLKVHEFIPRTSDLKLLKWCSCFCIAFWWVTDVVSRQECLFLGQFKDGFNSFCPTVTFVAICGFDGSFDTRKWSNLQYIWSVMCILAPDLIRLKEAVTEPAHFPITLRTSPCIFKFTTMVVPIWPWWVHVVNLLRTRGPSSNQHST